MINKKAFTLIELLVVVAIIGILAAVGVTTFNGFQEKAKKAASVANFKSVAKYISYEVMKCSLGDSKVMEGNLDCSKQGSYNWPDDVADATVLTLNSLKNPYDTNASAPLTKGGQYWYDKDVGYVRVHTESVTQLEVLICVKTPCGNKSSVNTYHTLVTIDD